MVVTTRFAPSPTWYVHIWSLRTVLYNYLFAKKNNGKFMLRVEDTDRNRLVEWSIENLLKVLASVGLIPDEWPNNPWNLWPYYQSERLEIYQKYVKELIKNDKAYYCFCSSERLTSLRTEQKELWLATKYDKKWRFLSNEEIENNLKQNIPYTIRLKVPDNILVEFNDIIKGKVKVMSKDIDEQILLKTDWFPTYHLANVIDDHLMNITHVIRWDEWTPSTPKHVLLYDAFWWEKPFFAHIPLLLWKDKKKLSKRTWDVSVESYLEKWYLVEAIMNYIALLWWNPKTTEEFFNMEELINLFDLNNVHKSWAVFDVEKLNYFNSNYLKNYEINKLYNKFENYLKKYDTDFLNTINSFWEDYNKKILLELKTKIKKFDEFKNSTWFFYKEPSFTNTDLFFNKKMKIDSIEIIKRGLNIALDIVSSNNNFNSIDEIKEIFIEKIKLNNMKNGQVLWPVRVALSWESFSPWALELIFVLWNEKSSKRIKKVFELLWN